MPLRSIMLRIPPEIREEFDQRLVRQGFTDYDGIVRWLNERLKEVGYGKTVSRSAAARYGKNLERRIAAIRAAADHAQAIMEAIGDDSDLLGAAIITLIQERALSVLLQMKELDPKQVDFLRLTEALARIGSASIQQKKWQAELKARAEKAVQNIEMRAKKRVSAEVLKMIREEIYGLA